MAEENDKRMKFCRYCDGMIEWGTKVCPHCNESLEVTAFDDMDFVTSSGPPPKVAGLREKPKLPKDMVEARQRALERRKAKAAQAESAPPPAKPKAPPAKPQIPPGTPELTPIPPQLTPISKPTRPPREPDDMETQVMPVMQPLEPVEQAPVMRPLDQEMPAVPILAPMDEGGLPPGVLEVADCPVCGQDMEPGSQGGTCGSCDAVVCSICLMRANAVRVSNEPELDLSRWRGHLARSRPEQIRCPACGKLGVSGP